MPDLLRPRSRISRRSRLLTKSMSLIVMRGATGRNRQGADREGQGQSRQAQHGRRHDHIAARRADVRESGRHRRPARASRAGPRSVRPCSPARSISRSTPGTGLPLIQGGQYRALAKYSNRPLPLLPDCRALGRGRLPEIDESSTWIGLLAPAGPPGAMVDKIRREVARSMPTRRCSERLQKAGFFPVARRRRSSTLSSEARQCAGRR